MVSSLDKVHITGMSESDSVFLRIDELDGQPVEPPIEVVLEGEDTRVAVTRDGLAARYDDGELRVIGEGNATLGLRRVIGAIAAGNNFTEGVTKPLHPTMRDVEVVSPAELPAARSALTA